MSGLNGDVERGVPSLPPQEQKDEWECSICKHHKTNIEKPLFPFIPRSGALSGQPWWWSGEKPQALRRRLAEALESRKAHITIVILTLLDLCIVMTELVLASFYPDVEERPDSVEKAEEAFSWTSIAILSLFTIEQLVRLAVFGFQYFAHLWHALDALIIIASLVLESVLRGAAQETVSLLVIFRLWRLVRIMHGTIETAMIQHEENIEKHHKVEIEMNTELLHDREIIQVLRRQLIENGIDIPSEGDGVLPQNQI